MEKIGNNLRGLAIIGGLIGSLLFAHAQTVTQTIPSGAVSLDDPNVDWASLSDVAVELKAIEAMPTVPADALPSVGTFISAQHALDWPPLPGNIRGLDCWPLDTNLFLINDLSINYSAKPKATQPMTAMARNMMAMDVPSPGDGGDGGTNTFTFNESSYMVDYGTNLWIAQVAIVSNSLVGIATNSVVDTPYEIQSCENLLAGWSSEGAPVYGSETTNWTPFSVAMNNRTNLFVRIKSWADTQGVGIPDWWQLLYFHEIGIDPNADPDNDGRSNIQEFLMGTDPTVFDMPDAPSNFVAVLSTNGTNVLLSWTLSPWLVPNYTTIGRYDYNYQTGDWDFTSLGSVNSNATSFVDVGAIKGGDYFDSYYQIQAVYAHGSTPVVTSWIYLNSPIPPTFTYNIPITARLVRNSTGRWQLMCLGLSADAQTIRLTWTDSNGNSVSQDISTNSLTDGIYSIPDTDAVNYMGNSLSVQLLGLNGEPGQFAQAGFLPNDAPYFVDGRRHMKQNLNFLIRGACPDLPYMGVNWPYYSSGSYNQNSTNFEEFSFLHHSSYYSSEENMSQTSQKN